MDLAKSYIRSFSHAPYNHYYRCQTLERQLIARGSVLHYRLNEPWDQSGELQLGLYRESGLGRVWVNPQLLAQAKVTTTQTPALVRALPERPEYALLDWLEACQTQAEQERQDHELAEQWAMELVQCYQSARILNGVDPGVRLGPSATQWGRVRDLAREQIRKPNTNQFHRDLFTSDNAVCKPGDPEWGEKLLQVSVKGSGTGLPTFRDWLDRKFAELQGGEKRLGRVFSLLARKAINHARDEQKEAK